MHKTPVADTDLWVMLLSTIRYSMGRATYMPSLCTDLYHQYKHALVRRQQEQIAEEIEEELRRAECLDRTLGHDCDHHTWRELATTIRRELAQTS